MDFETIYARYFRKVYSFALSLSRNAHTAEELTQETFYRVLKKPDAFQGRSSLETYLCGIAHNLYMDALKKQKRWAQGFDPDTLPDTDNMEEQLASRETARQLHLLLHRLEEPYKEVFTLRVFGELSYSDIGSLFGKGEGWAWVTFYRAKVRLQDMMKTEGA